MCYINGITIMLAIFQLLAVPMILLRMKLTWLIMCWVLAMGILIMLFIYRIKRQNTALKDTSGKEREKSLTRTCLMAGAVALIFFQMYMYAAYQQMDEDDSRFIVTALEAVENNIMYLNDPATGELLDGFEGELAKDVTSPWAMFIAMTSQITHIHPAILGHTIIPVILVLMAYLIYWNLAKHFFGEREEECWFFLILASILNIFGNASIYTSFTFFLSRLWQGKAVVAGVFLPLMLFWLLKIYQKPDCKEYYIRLLIVNTGSCLMSGMGIALGAFFVGLFGGTMALLKKDLRMLCALACTCIPNVVYALISAVAL